MATELVNPTRTATKPAVNTEGIRSLKKRMGSGLLSSGAAEWQRARQRLNFNFGAQLHHRVIG